MTEDNSAYSIYRLHYGTSVNSVNDAVVSANSPEEAQALLRNYLSKHPLNAKFPESTMPDSRGIRWSELEVQATKSVVIYCSLDSQQEAERKAPSRGVGM